MFINEESLKEKDGGPGLERQVNKTAIRSSNNFMGIVRNDGQGFFSLNMGEHRGPLRLAVSPELKELGEFVNYCCLLGEWDSDEV